MLFEFRYRLKETFSRCIWKFGLNSSCVSSPQLSADDTRLYVASLGGDVFAFESNQGKLQWKRSLKNPIFSTLTIWNEKFLLIGCVDHKLYCLNCDNGQQVNSL